MQEGCAGVGARATLEKAWMAGQMRPNQNGSLLGREQNLKFHVLEHMEALERRQRKVLIKINDEIGTIKKSIHKII